MKKLLGVAGIVVVGFMLVLSTTAHAWRGGCFGGGRVMISSGCQPCGAPVGFSSPCAPVTSYSGCYGVPARTVRVYSCSPCIVGGYSVVDPQGTPNDGIWYSPSDGMRYTYNSCGQPQVYAGKPQPAKKAVQQPPVQAPTADYEPVAPQVAPTPAPVPVRTPPVVNNNRNRNTDVTPATPAPSARRRAAPDSEEMIPAPPPSSRTQVDEGDYMPIPSSRR